MTNDETLFWDKVCIERIKRGFDVARAVESADQALMLRQKRWGSPKHVYR